MHTHKDPWGEGFFQEIWEGKFPQMWHVAAEESWWQHDRNQNWNWVYCEKGLKSKKHIVKLRNEVNKYNLDTVNTLKDFKLL